MLTVSELFIYPIKSLGGIAVSIAQVTSRGLQYDRRWMLVDNNNIFITQRDHAAMALFDVAIEADGLLVTYQPDGAAIFVPFVPQTGEIIMAEVWSDRCKAIVVSHEANAWFSSKLGIACRLVYMPDTVKRRVDGRYAIDKEIVSFADGYPMLLIGQASLDDLNSRLQEKLTIQRFRPNIVFTGGEPYEEDVMETFTIGNILFFGVKLCARCIITTINPNTAVKGKEPLRTLAAYRMRNNRIYFGQNLLHQGEGLLRRGDTIAITQRKLNAINFR